MKITVKVHPWRGAQHVSPADATILTVLDRWNILGDGERKSVHTVDVGGVPIYCTGFHIGVDPQDVFMNATFHHVEKVSWDAFVERHGYEGMSQESGTQGYEENGTPIRIWWRGCDLVVPVSSLELEVVPVEEPSPV